MDDFKLHILSIVEYCMNLLKDIEIELNFTRAGFHANYLKYNHKDDDTRLKECIQYLDSIYNDKQFKKFINSEMRVRICDSYINLQHITGIGVGAFSYTIDEFKYYLEIATYD